MQDLKQIQKNMKNGETLQISFKSQAQRSQSQGYEAQQLKIKRDAESSEDEMANSQQ